MSPSEIPQTVGPDAAEANAPELMARLREQEEATTRYRRLAEATFEGIIVHQHGLVVDANPAMAAMVGYSLPELIGSELLALVAPESRPLVLRNVQAGYDQPYEIAGLHKDGTAFPAEICGKTTELHGEPVRVVAVRDITERQAAEAERQRLRDEVIAAQALALAELSTPLLLISDGVLLMPLIGSLDTRRAQQVLESVLQGVSEHRAQVVILDITGTPVVDTAVANALIHAAQAVRLLGASVYLTGIRPEVAQTIVGLGVTLAGISTFGSLQRGIASALRAVEAHA